MRPENAGQRLKAYLQSQEVPCDSGVPDHRIGELEGRCHIRMPADLRSYFMTMNGSAGEYAYGIIRFWNLNDFKSVEEEMRNKSSVASQIMYAYRDKPVENAAQYFIFADCMIDSQFYAIHLTSALDGLSRIILLDGSEPVKVADTFSQFIDLYITSPERLRLILD